MESNHTERPHNRFSGSQAHRWVQCSASVALIETLPKKESSKEALWGTKLHEIGEKALKHFLDYKLTGVVKPDSWKTECENEEELALVTGYVQAVWEKVLLQSVTAKPYGIEEEFFLNEKLGMGGIVDFWCTYINEKGQKVLAICDLKTGYYPVEVKKNAQLIFYAGSILRKLMEEGKSVDVVRTGVFQPRVNAETYREYTYNVKQIKSWNTKFLKVVTALLVQKRSKFKVGHWCTFCPAQGACHAYAQSLSIENHLALVDKDEALPEVTQLSDLIIAKIALYGPRLEEFIKAVRSHAIQSLLNGKALPGVKLVEAAKPRRKWKETKEEEIAASLMERGIVEPWQKRLVTITSVEKTIGQGKIEDLVELSPQTYSLVPLSDSRPGVKSAIELLSEIKT